MPVGFASLPNQRHRIVSRRGGVFTVLVVGSSGAGKTTFINTLFSTILKDNKKQPRTNKNIDRTVSIDVVRADVEERGFNVRLNVIDTPGFGDYMNNSDCWLPIVNFIDEQHLIATKLENLKTRSFKDDLRVHACIYFIQPTGQTLSSLDIKVMKELGSRVNLIPVISKGDTITKSSCREFKKRILNCIKEHGISIYHPPVDDDPDNLAKEIIEAMPFSIISSEKEVTVKGNKVRGREYLWGVAEVENPDHCEFVHLRNLLIRTNMYDLIESTESHYENFRAQYLQKTGVSDKAIPISATGGMGTSTDKMDLEKMKESEETLRKRFTEQVRAEEARFRKWENKLIAERDRLNKDLEEAHKMVRALALEVEELELGRPASKQ